MDTISEGVLAEGEKNEQSNSSIKSKTVWKLLLTWANLKEKEKFYSELTQKWKYYFQERNLEMLDKGKYEIISFHNSIGKGGWK
jgi:hypothetical protein